MEYLTEGQAKEIRQIVKQELHLKELLRNKETVTTPEACEMLKCSRQWLSRNRELFDGKIKNRRGDLVFSTRKIAEYKIRMKLT